MLFPFPSLHPWDLSARPSIHARQLPGGIGDPMLSAGQIPQARAIRSIVMVSLSRMDVCTALDGSMSIGLARCCHRLVRSANPYHGQCYRFKSNLLHPAMLA
jgi:hypothetical protein